MAESTPIGDVQRFRLMNRLASDLEVRLEPLGDRIIMPPGATYEIHLELHSGGQLGDCLEIAVAERKATVYGWLQSIFLVSGDGSRTCIWPETAS